MLSHKYIVPRLGDIAGGECYTSLMNPLESIVLGATQGLTEFIPVSSSGHLTIMQTLLGGDPTGFHLFLEFINLGTLLALLIFFRAKIWKIVVDIFVRHDWRLAINVLITSIPAGIIGLALGDFIEETPFFGAVVIHQTTVSRALITGRAVAVLMLMLIPAMIIKEYQARAVKVLCTLNGRF